MESTSFGANSSMSELIDDSDEVLEALPERLTRLEGGPSLEELMLDGKTRCGGTFDGEWWEGGGGLLSTGALCEFCTVPNCLTTLALRLLPGDFDSDLDNDERLARSSPCFNCFLAALMYTWKSVICCGVWFFDSTASSRSAST